FQTAVYRREKFKVASELSEFNEKILTSLGNRLEANLVPPADVILARVESRAARQLAKAAPTFMRPDRQWPEPRPPRTWPGPIASLARSLALSTKPMKPACNTSGSS